MTTGHSVANVATRAGISERQVDHWTRGGHLFPLPREATHQGYPRRYNDVETRIAEIMGTLTRAGLTVATAATAARQSVIAGFGDGPAFAAELDEHVAVFGRTS